MYFSNALIFTPDGYRYGSFRTENGVFTEITDRIIPGGRDLCGMKVIPGLIDIHVHGCAGADFSDGDTDGLYTMGKHLAAHGVTGFLPASMSLPYTALERAFHTARDVQKKRPADCAKILGVHMEGPFLSERKKGAQNGAYLQEPDRETFKRLYDSCDGIIRIVDLAPELPGAADFTAYAKEYCTVSAAHTDASYTEASAVFSAGADHLTHLFNAMPALHHRDPGVIGAAAERDDVYAELICDGIHVHPSAVRAAFRLFPSRICLISDSVRCTGMPEGEYTLGGQTVFLRDGAVRLADGTLAGSAINLYDGLRNAVRFGIPEEDAIRAATLNPARSVRTDRNTGSVEAEKSADFIICTHDLSILGVFLGGKQMI